MKTFFYSLILILFQFAFFTETKAQKSGKMNDIHFEVQGNCGQCESRIEQAAMRLSGVKLAEWDKSSNKMRVVYNTHKVNEEQIHEAIAKAGHSTNKKAKDAVSYENLPDCCKNEHKHKH
jgi:mercuric ion binding protein